MSNRYEDLPPAARNLMTGFDAYDLAAMCAEQQAENVRLQQRLVEAQAELAAAKAAPAAPPMRAGRVVDLTDPGILLHVVSRLGPHGTAVTEAGNPGIARAGAAYLLRQIADQWNPAQDQHTEITELWIQLRQRTDQVRATLAAVADGQLNASAQGLGVILLGILDGPDIPKDGG